MSFKLFKTIALVGMLYASHAPMVASSVIPRAAQASAQLAQIAPSSTSCAGAPFPSECATNVQAANPLIKALGEYQIYDVYLISAVLATTAFESGEFKYNINHFPGTPGQGTRAMLPPASIKKYVQSIPALAPKLATAKSDVEVLSLVLGEDYTWGAAAYWMAKECSPEVRAAVATGTMDGFNNYVKDCLFTTVTPERQAAYTRAKAAFGLS